MISIKILPIIKINKISLFSDKIFLPQENVHFFVLRIIQNIILIVI